jgi:hypothetical protein
VAYTQPERSEHDLADSSHRPAPLTDDCHSDGPPSVVWFTICAWCARMRVRDRWIDVERGLETMGSVDDLRLTHGICPACFEETARQADRERRARTERQETEGKR